MAVIMNRLVLLGCLILICLGSVVLLGWLTSDINIVQFFGFSNTAMQFNTALGFICVGLGVILSEKYPIITVVIGLLLLLFGAMTLFEYVFAYNTGIDEFFFKTSPIIQSYFPGRPGPNTALCFLLIGFIFVFRLARLSIWLSGLMFSFAMLITSIGLVALVGYILDISTAYGWGDWTAMALQTSIGMIIAGLMLIGYIHGLIIKQDQKRFRHLPIGIFVFFIIFFILLWQSLSKHDKEEALHVLSELSYQTAKIYTDTFGRNVFALSRMQKRLNHMPQMNLQFWKDDAKEYLKDFTSMDAIGLIYVNTLQVEAIEYQVGESGSQNTIRDCMIQLKQTNRVDEPLRFLKDDPSKLCMVYKIGGNHDNRYLVGILDIGLLTNRISHMNIDRGYGIEILKNNQTIYRISNSSPNLKAKWSVITPIEYDQLGLRLLIWPDANILNYLNTRLPFLILLIGFVIAILFSISIWSLQIIIRKRNQIFISEERFRRLIEGTKDYAIIMLDEDGYITMWNAGAEEMKGYKENEIIGKHFSIFYPKQAIWENHPDSILAIAKIKGKFEEEGWRVKKDGSIFWAHVIISPIFDSEHRLIGYSKLTRDLSEQKTQQASITQLNQQLQTILHSSHLSIIATDLSGYITHFNHAAELMLEYSADEMIGKKTPTAFHDIEEINRRAEALTKQLGRPVAPGFDTFVSGLGEKDADENEWTYITKSGKRIPILLSITVLRDENNNINGYLGIALDISERKEVDKVKNEFISMVSHELRTPLTSIHGSIALLAKNIVGKQSPESMKLVQIALKNSERLIRLINDILDLEKIEAGKMQFHLKPESIKLLLEESISLNKAYADNFSIKMHFTNNLSADIYVNVDRDRFIQAMTNLISNAVKFSSANDIVEMSVSSTDEFVKVEVADKGPGIPKKFQPFIFQKFSQADSSTVRRQQGTGLGLSITKLIIESMGGSIGYTTKIDAGTTFYFYLPICPSDVIHSEKKETN